MKKFSLYKLIQLYHYLLLYISQLFLLNTTLHLNSSEHSIHARPKQAKAVMVQNHRKPTCSPPPPTNTQMSGAIFTRLKMAKAVMVHHDGNQTCSFPPPPPHLLIHTVVVRCPTRTYQTKAGEGSNSTAPWEANLFPSPSHKHTDVRCHIYQTKDGEGSDGTAQR